MILITTIIELKNNIEAIYLKLIPAMYIIDKRIRDIVKVVLISGWKKIINNVSRTYGIRFENNNLISLI